MPIVVPPPLQPPQASPDGEQPVLAPPKSQAARVPIAVGPMRRLAARLLGPLQRERSSACVISMLVHVTAIVLMGLIVWSGPRGDDLVTTLGPIDDDLNEPIDEQLLAGSMTPRAAVEVASPEAFDPTVVGAPISAAELSPQPESVPIHNGPLEAPRAEDWGRNHGQPSEGFAQGGGLSGRSAAARARLVAQRGGNEQSETAVERGLQWLAEHQRSGGGWRFDHRGRGCNCRNHGSVASTTGATAMALLPFLGAGYTHQQGRYQHTVERGLYYLTSRALMNKHGADLQEGTMYAQGLAAIALCEAYAMTDDEGLKPFAEAALAFIVHAQNEKTGGWRYLPGQPGDTTVLGWQLMALRSGRMADVDFPPHVVYGASRFLDGVQDGDGAYYGYQKPEQQPTTTSVGLLCRMYLGWDREHEALTRGVEYLSREGPSRDNMYYNYYATQVISHWGGRHWERWNPRMRDYLVATQATEGHERGSWYFSGGHAQTGGRLYNTAMAVMTLEVYYRYMPLYQQAAVADGF